MSYYLQEDGTSKFLLEDGSGFYLLEGPSGPSITDTGAAVSDSLASLRLRPPSDAGLSVADSIAAAAIPFGHVTDTGLAVADSIQKAATHFLADTGATVTDAPPQRVSVLADDAFAGIAANTPVLDDCNRPDESILSDGGRWTRAGTLVSQLGLFSHSIYGLGLNSQMSFTAIGDIGDAEAWATITGLPSSGSYVGVVARQDPASSTGANCYVCRYKTGTGIEILRYDGSGVGTVLATYAVSAVGGDEIGLRAAGSVLTAWYKPTAGSWGKVLSVTDSTLTHGYVGVRASGFFNGTITAFGGGPVYDSLVHSHPVALSDTGLSVSDSIFRFFPIRDTGLVFSDSLRKHVTPKPLVDTGVTVSDSLGRIELTDTGLAFSESLAARRVVPRAITDTGATVTDSTLKVARKVVSDVGLSFNSALVVRKNGANTSVNLADVAVTVVSSLAKAAHLFRSIPNTVVPDRGVTVTDGLFAQVNGGPPGSCTNAFRLFLLDLDASPDYTSWCSANPAECSAWTTYSNAILAGGTPSPPTMSTGFGSTLVDAGIIALAGIVSCRANLPSGAPHAAFSFAVGGLDVSFANLSTPGASGLFDSWLWDFGDGDTDTTTWSPIHAYAMVGTYVVTLTVVGAAGDGISSARHLVRVFVPSTTGFHIDAVIV